MAIINKSDRSKGIRPTANCTEVGTVKEWREEYTLLANPVANDTITVGILLAGHLPTDFILDSDDVDTNGVPTIAMSVGILNAGETDLSTAAADGGAVWLSASAVGTTGGLARPTTAAVKRVTVSTSDRKIGVKFTAVAATFASGKVGVSLSYRAANYNG